MPTLNFESFDELTRALTKGAPLREIFGVTVGDAYFDGEGWTFSPEGDADRTHSCDTCEGLTVLDLTPAEAAGDIVRLGAENERLREQLAAALHAPAELRDELEEIRHAGEHRMALVQEAREERDEAREEREALGDELDEVRGELEEVRGELEDKEQELEGAAEERDEAREERDEAREARVEWDATRRAVDEVAAQRDEARKERDEARKLLDEAMEERHKARAQARGRGGRLASLLCPNPDDQVAEVRGPIRGPGGLGHAVLAVLAGGHPEDWSGVAAARALDAGQLRELTGRKRNSQVHACAKSLCLRGYVVRARDIDPRLENGRARWVITDDGRALLARSWTSEGLVEHLARMAAGARSENGATAFGDLFPSHEPLRVIAP